MRIDRKCCLQFKELIVQCKIRNCWFEICSQENVLTFQLSLSQGTFHAKMGSIKDRNGMDLREAEDIKKRWQEYTELYKKELHDPDNHHSVITHLEPDILECEVK